VDDRFAFVIGDDTDLERRAVSTWSYEHRHRRVVGSESSPVMPIAVKHVFVSDTVRAGARLDVHLDTLPERHITSTHVDAKAGGPILAWTKGGPQA